MLRQSRTFVTALAALATVGTAALLSTTAAEARAGFGFYGGSHFGGGQFHGSRTSYYRGGNSSKFTKKPGLTKISTGSIQGKGPVQGLSPIKAAQLGPIQVKGPVVPVNSPAFALPPQQVMPGPIAANNPSLIPPKAVFNPPKGCMPFCQVKGPVVGPIPAPLPLPLPHPLPVPGPAAGPGPGPAFPIGPSMVVPVGPDVPYATSETMIPTYTQTVTTAPTNSGNCLTKEYASNAQVLFKDVCTKEMAMAPVNSTAEPVVKTATQTVTTSPANGSNCLTKEYASNAQVLFKDVCTGEMAMAPVNSAAQPAVKTAPPATYQLGLQSQDPALQPLTTLQ